MVSLFWDFWDRKRGALNRVDGGTYWVGGLIKEGTFNITGVRNFLLCGGKKRGPPEYRGGAFPQPFSGGLKIISQEKTPRVRKFVGNPLFV